MDELLLSLISGISNGAVYGLVGPGPGDHLPVHRRRELRHRARSRSACMYLASSLTGAGIPLALALLAGIAVVRTDRRRRA